MSQNNFDTIVEGPIPVLELRDDGFELIAKTFQLPVHSSHANEFLHEVCHQQHVLPTSCGTHRGFSALVSLFAPAYKEYNVTYTSIAVKNLIIVMK
jgi:hypothetical protein